jgi:hypothetical protein
VQPRIRVYLAELREQKRRLMTRREAEKALKMAPQFDSETYAEFRTSTGTLSIFGLVPATFLSNWHQHKPIVPPRKLLHRKAPGPSIMIQKQLSDSRVNP